MVIANTHRLVGHWSMGVFIFYERIFPGCKILRRVLMMPYLKLSLSVVCQSQGLRN